MDENFDVTMLKHSSSNEHQITLMEEETGEQVEIEMDELAILMNEQQTTLEKILDVGRGGK